MLKAWIKVILVFGIVAGVALSSGDAFGHNVLVLSTGSATLDSRFQNVLRAYGHVVTIGTAYSRFDGAGLNGQDAVLLLPNVNWSAGDMPLSGQTALVNFVSSGGGLVTSEWTVWMSAFGSFTNLVPLFAVQPHTGYGESLAITYVQAAADPILNKGLPSSINFVADYVEGTETLLVPRPNSTTFYHSTGSARGAGVVGWQFGSGRVIQFSTLLGDSELADVTFGHLVSNAVSLAGKLRLTVNQMSFEPAIVRASNYSTARFTGESIADDTYLDVRFRAPGSTTDEVALNWQQGVSVEHSIPSGSAPGIWTITGARAHQNKDDHDGDFDPISATLAVTQASCLVTTAAGDIQGVDLGASCAFLGVPYAAAPIGGLRWKPPQPAPKWSSPVLFATTPPSNCTSFNQAGLPAGSEDCLRLNIWMPKAISTTSQPVIVWLHTGGFVAASANFAGHNGQQMAEREGVVVVAPNYRLGPFGLMAHPALTGENAGYRSSGNYGFLDQRAALTWVRDNISSFGGDAGKVTIGGQSAGAHSVSLHVVSPGSAGLFQRAIMESGYASTRWKTIVEAESQGNDFAIALGCTNPAQVLACLRSKSREDVLRAAPPGREEFIETANRWNPVVDGFEIPDQPRLLYEQGAFNRVPILLGANRDEGWTYVDRSFPSGLTESQYQSAIETEFGGVTASILARYPAREFPSPKEALAQLTGDVEYICEAARLAELVERSGQRVYLYSLEYVMEGLAANRVIHGLDTNLVFRNNYVAPNPGNRVLTASDLALSSAVSRYWARFAASGDPNVPKDEGAVQWSAFRRPIAPGIASDQYLILDSVIREGKRLRGAQCDFLRPFFFRSIVGAVSASMP